MLAAVQCAQQAWQRRFSRNAKKIHQCLQARRGRAGRTGNILDGGDLCSAKKVGRDSTPSRHGEAHGGVGAARALSRACGVSVTALWTRKCPSAATPGGSVAREPATAAWNSNAAGGPGIHCLIPPRPSRRACAHGQSGQHMVAYRECDRCFTRPRCCCACRPKCRKTVPNHCMRVRSRGKKRPRPCAAARCCSGSAAHGRFQNHIHTEVLEETCGRDHQRPLLLLQKRLMPCAPPTR